jgi:hypothetical protein
MRNPERTALAVLVVFALSLAAAAPAPAWAKTAHRHHHAPDPIDALITPIADPATDPNADPIPDPATDADAQGTPSATVTSLSDWSVRSGDNQGRPFIVIDKPTAEVFVFDASGLLLGAAPALLGSALGDDAAPGVGDLELSDIPLDQRTTEAGRFIAHIGPAQGMSSVLWVDFGSSLSMHPVITSNPREQRLLRLSSPVPEDRRITHGCINVPAAFYRDVVRRTFSDSEGVVYILPDTESVDQAFPEYAAQTENGFHKTRRHRRADVLESTDPDDSSQKPQSDFGARF